MRFAGQPFTIGGSGLYKPATALTAPQDDLVYHLKADGLSLNDNDKVGTWPDDSPNSYDATSAGGDRPTYKTNIKNGLPSVLFTAASEEWMLSGAFSPHFDQPNTFYAVLYANSEGNMQITDGKAGSARHAFATASNPTWRTRLYAGATLVDGPGEEISSGEWFLFTAQYNGASTLARINGVETDTGSTGTHKCGQLRIATYDESSGFWDGYISEFLIYNAAHGAAEFAAVETDYLSAKWDLGL